MQRAGEGCPEVGPGDLLVGDPVFLGVKGVGSISQEPQDPVRWENAGTGMFQLTGLDDGQGSHHPRPGALEWELLLAGWARGVGGRGPFSVVGFPAGCFLGFSQNGAFYIFQVPKKEVKFLSMDSILATLLGACRSPAGAGREEGLRMGPSSECRWVPKTRHMTEALGKVE